MNKSVGFLLVFFIFGGCINKLDDSSSPGDLPRPLTATEEKLIDSSLNFSYELFRSVNNSASKENLIISPFSLFMALGLPLNGAFGETRDSIQETLNLNGMNLEEINDASGSLSDLIFGLNTEGDMQLASSLWHRDDLSVKESFVQTVQKHYNSDVLELDPENNEAAGIVNEWIRERTNERINHIMDVVSRYMVLYLIDAVHFEGKWRHGFRYSQKEETFFYTEEGDSLEVDLMEQEAEVMTYFSDEVQMVDLPYSNGYFTMTLMLPAEQEQPVDEFISEYLTKDRVSAWIQSMDMASVFIQLPKFDLAQEYSLQNTFGAMGMSTAFEPSADFYNINEGDGVYLSDVRHKAILRISEEGKERAQQISISPERRMQLNRPFVFLLRERHSGLIILMGKVGNPVE